MGKIIDTIRENFESIRKVIAVINSEENLLNNSIDYKHKKSILKNIKLDKEYLSSLRDFNNKLFSRLNRRKTK